MSLAKAMFDRQMGRIQRMQMAVSQAHSQLVAASSPQTRIEALSSSKDPVHWPPRTEADEVVRKAGEVAEVHGVSLRTLSASHQTASTQIWGRVTLDVTLSGSYAALKAWQAAMQQRFPSLSVQSLRMQGIPSSAGAQDAQLIWVFHVRD